MTETFPFSLTYLNGSFEVSQPTNGNYVLTSPDKETVFLVHPSNPNYYYFGNQGFAITLDYTLSTNLTTASRKAQIEAAIALAPSGSAVSVTNFPANYPVTQVTTPWVTTSTPSIPAPSDIVGASRTTTGTLYTVPAGRTFSGSVSLSTSIAVAGNSQPTIAVAGTGVSPTGTIHQIHAVGLALTTVANSNTQNNVMIFGGTSGATVSFTQGASGVSSGQITGRLL